MFIWYGLQQIEFWIICLTISLQKYIVFIDIIQAPGAVFMYEHPILKYLMFIGIIPV